MAVYEILSAKSFIKLINTFINSKMTKLNDVITIMIIFMNNGALKNNYEMLEIKEELRASNGELIIDLVKNYYINKSNELFEAFSKFEEEFPEAIEKNVTEQKEINYFINTGSSNIRGHLSKTYANDDDKYDRACKYVFDILRPLDRELSNPDNQKLCEYFGFSENTFKPKKRAIFKMLDNALSVDDYNKILANHYKFEVSIDE
jgi:hypothetical protein